MIRSRGRSRLADRGRVVRAAFTLVEVMVALAIVSLVVFSLLLSASAASRDAYVASRFRTARILADELMGEIFLGIEGRELGTTEGTFERDDEEGGYPDVHWEISVIEEEWTVQTQDEIDAVSDPTSGVDPFTLPDPEILHRVQLRVWFDGFEGNEEGEITLETIRAPYGASPGSSSSTYSGDGPGDGSADGSGDGR